MSLAAALRRGPDEIERMSFHDACTLLATLRREEFEDKKFNAKLAGFEVR